MHRRRLLTLAAAMPLIGAGMPAALAAPAAVLWDDWSAHDPGSGTHVDHAPWDRFLGRHVKSSSDGINRIEYAAVRATDRDGLKAYLDDMAEVRVTALARAEQFAYWVNLYNALTVDVILTHYPVDSIREIDISPGLFANGPWGKPLITIEDRRVSLDDIEHRILRPIWRDPRIHYAVNCAALGCPNLAPTAFTADNSEDLLHAGAIAFVNHDRGCRIESGRLHVSSIYSWFGEDFGGDDAGVIAHLRQYASGTRALALVSQRAIADHSYDWRLNDAGASL